MASEVQANVTLRPSYGQNRSVFRNPRGLKRYYVFYRDAGNQLDYEWSSDGSDWTNAPLSAMFELGAIESWDVKILDDGAQLEIWVVGHYGNAIYYRYGTIGDWSNTITWNATQTIDAAINDQGLIGSHIIAVARTDNGRIVVAFTEGATDMGKDYRLTMLIGSDGDGAAPGWAGETIWDDPTSNSNNEDKGLFWFGLETMSGDRVFLYARVPEGTDAGNYEIATAVPTWAGVAFANIAQNKAISGAHDDDGKIISGVVDEADRAHIIYFDGTNTRLDSRRAGTVDDDDWAAAVTVKSADIDACTLTLDTIPATDELYAFYHDVADAADFHYKISTISSPHSWGSEQTVTFASDMVALTSWNRDIEDGLHIGIEDADTDVWYHELDVSGVPSVGQPTPIRTQGTPTGSGYRDRIGGWN